MVAHQSGGNQSALQGNAWVQRLRLAGGATLAGLLLSLPIGLLNRLYMRVSILMDHGRPEFSWFGLMAVMLVTTILVAPTSALLYVLLRRLPSWRASLLSGALLLLLMGVPFVISAPNGLNTIGNRLVNQLMYGSLFLFQGLGIVPVANWMLARLPQGQKRPGGALVGYGLLSVLGVGLLVLALVLMVTGGSGV